MTDPDPRAAAALEPDWLPCAPLESLRARAGMLARIRAFFLAEGVLEVETPILSGAAVTDPALASLQARLAHRAQPLYLQTSPEFPMKRLLAAGSGPIYQIAKVFRDDERGRRHHPELSLLEWYRPGWEYGGLMDEVAALARAVLDRPGLSVERIAYCDLFRQRLDIDPWQTSPEALRQAAAECGIPGAERLELDQDAWLDLLLSQVLEPGLGSGCMTFLYDYPPSQAALARLRQGPYPVAERFELYLEGMELANGFQELADPAEQRARFEADLCLRRSRGQCVPPIDERLLAALESGLPPCSGVALGLDRLLMIALGADHIDQVLAFPIERA